MTEPRFLVVACAPGVEPWLKAEIAREHPGLHPSYARPGLVTFKDEGAGPLAPQAVRSVFARVVASSHGRLAAGGLASDFVRARRASTDAPLRVLVHEGPPRRGVAPYAAAAELRALLEAQLAGSSIAIGGRAQPGERVVDVFTAPGDDVWLGEHDHAPPMQPWAAGDPPIALPEGAPSRAFLKIEEAIAWADLPVRAGQTAVEVGSAPGGASLALLRRGVSVIGVDPGAMDPVVVAFGGEAGGPTFRHLQVPVGALAKSDLPRDVDWLALDVNLAPPVALRYAERIVGPRRDRLRGAVFTLKMNDAEMAAKIPALLDRVRAMGFASVRATQLPTNRREICVVGLTAGPAATRAAKRPAASRRGSRAPTST